MKNTAQQLRSVINKYSGQLDSLHEEEWINKPNPAKWSKKEVLGHLVDSAQNNIRRFVVAQYEENSKIMYAQDNWVAAADYQSYQTEDLINLWVLLNKHICVILERIPPSVEERLSVTNEPHSITWLASDYIKHLLHHLHHALNLEPIAYP